MIKKIIKNYNEYITEKLSDKLSGFDEDELKQQLETGELNIFKYIEMCKKYKLKLPLDNEIFDAFKKLNPNFIILESCKINLLLGVAYALEYPIAKNYIEYSLHTVIEKNNIDILEYMIDNIEDIDLSYNDGNLLFDAVRLKRFEIIKILLEHNNFEKSINDSMTLAINIEQYEIVKYLIEHGADIHYKSDYVLNKAISVFNRDMINFLIEHDANIENVVFGIYNLIDENKVSDIEYLLNIGGINVDDDMIKYTVDGCFYDIIKLFIKYYIPFSKNVLQYIREQNDDELNTIIDNAVFNI